MLYNKFPYWWIGSDLQIVRSKLNHQKPIDTMQMQMRAHHLDFMRQYWSRKSKCRPAAEEVLDFLEEATCVTLGAEMIFMILIPNPLKTPHPNTEPLLRWVVCHSVASLGII